MNLLQVLTKYKKEDAVLLEQEQFQTGLSKEEQRLLEEIKDAPKPFDSMLNENKLGQIIISDES